MNPASGSFAVLSSMLRIEPDDSGLQNAKIFHEILNNTVKIIDILAVKFSLEIKNIKLSITRASPWPFEMMRPSYTFFFLFNWEH